MKKDIIGKTRSGFDYKIDEEALDNVELLEMFCEMDENPLLFPKLLNALFGKQQKENLYNHIRSENGIVPASKLIEEIEDVFSNVKLKNL